MVADIIAVAVLAWPLAWVVGGMVQFTVTLVAAMHSGRTVVDTSPGVAQVAAVAVQVREPVVDSSEAFARARELAPLLSMVREVVTFDPGPCVSVVGVLRSLSACDKGGMIGTLADATGEIPVWLPNADGVTAPAEGAVVVLEGQVCCSSNHRRWLKAVSWGSAE